jgi:hypothetical protein
MRKIRYKLDSGDLLIMQGAATHSPAMRHTPKQSTPLACSHSAWDSSVRAPLCQYAALSHTVVRHRHHAELLGALPTKENARDGPSHQPNVSNHSSVVMQPSHRCRQEDRLRR